MKLYYVSPCDEGDGPRTWDVMRRETRQGYVARDESAAVGNYATRAEARRRCADLNGTAAAGRTT